MIEVSYERALTIYHMSLGFISAAPIMGPTALKKGMEMEVDIVGSLLLEGSEVYGIALPCLYYAGHLFTLVLVKLNMCHNEIFHLSLMQALELHSWFYS